jgi:predicted kinase
MVGLPCSGKTTTARILEKKYNALLLTPDVWQLKLYEFNGINDIQERQHDIVEKIMWDVAERVLTLGIDVILDFGFWAKEEREHFRAEAKRLGVGFMIHYMDIDNEELFKRIENRNKELPEGVFEVSKEKMEEYMKIFQPVGDEELNIKN